MSMQSQAWHLAPIIISTTDASATMTPLPKPTAEQVQATDHLFSKESEDNSTILGLFSFTTSLALLHHIAHENVRDDMDEEETEPEPLPDRPTE